MMYGKKMMAKAPAGKKAAPFKPCPGCPNKAKKSAPFKPCAGCPTPAKCSKMGMCAMKAKVK